MSTLRARRDAALAAIARHTAARIEIGLILGSGLGALADHVTDATTIPYADIDGLPVSTAPGHAGQLVIGTLFGRRAALMQGRLHLYEGWSAQEVALPVYLLAGLGAKRLIVTNAAGGLDPAFAPGEVMLIEDHLNFTGVNPLTGSHDPALGLRFPDLSRAYDPGLRASAIAAAARINMTLHRGIYAGVAGPSLETSAERRLMRAGGADAVGMSTVIEVIAAAHTGLATLGLSAITNAAAGGPDQAPDTIEDVLAHAALAGARIGDLLADLLPTL